MKHYRNWPEICKTKDFFLMMALSLVNLETTEGQVLVRAFPGLFSRTEVQGPIPWSVFKSLVERDARERDASPERFDGMLSFNKYWSRAFSLPVIEFAIDNGNSGLDSMPGEIQKQLDALNSRPIVKQVFSYQKKVLVLIEWNDDERGSDFSAAFVPIECFALDK